MSDNGVQVQSSAVAEQPEILNEAALSLVADLARRFGPRVRERLEARAAAQAARDAGALPDFDPATADVRSGDWRCPPIPTFLQDRRVEITGPVDRKMIINALNSGAKVFMADFEDSLAPTWDNVVRGHVNIRDAVRGTISWVDVARGKTYALADNPAVLMVRPRGWHLLERHVEVDGAPVAAALFDFAVYMFHNAAFLTASGRNPTLYLPKMEDWREAALWAAVIAHLEAALGVPAGCTKVTVLIETLPAAFCMDEIIHALRPNIVGLNCGRWDYIFSTIKSLRAHADRVLPDRDQITMTQPCMASYTKKLVQTCHRRGVFAMGGMAAQIPIKGDPERNDRALAKVRADKEREVRNGHDGTWVAHPGLVSIAMGIFDAHMPGPNQLDVIPAGDVGRDDLLAIPQGTRTLSGLRHNVRVGVQYLEAWLRGEGCVPLYDLMEDAATAEISRSQLWQWIRHGATLDDGAVIDRALVERVMAEEVAALSGTLPEASLRAAAEIFLDVAVREPFVDFLTLPAYDQIA